MAVGTPRHTCHHVPAPWSPVPHVPAPTTRAQAPTPTRAPDERAPLAAPAPPATSGPRRRSRRLLGLVVPLLVLAVWSALSATGALPSTLLPTPWSVATAAVDFVLPADSVTLAGIVPFDGAGAQHLSASIGRWLVAYLAAATIGLAVGMAMGLSRTVTDLLDPLVQGLRAIPIYAWLPLALVWFGFGEGAARSLVFIGALFPVVVATADGVARVPRRYVETALMLGTPRRQLARRVYLPAALPGIVTGLRLALSLGWMSVIVGELTGTASGIGAMMFAARQSGQLDQVLVGMGCFAVVGYLGDRGLRALTRRRLRWSTGA